MTLRKGPFENIEGKEKMLVTSIFSYSHNVFYPSKNIFQLSNHIYFIICKCFQLGPVLIFVVWGRVKPLPNDKILYAAKFKAFAGDKLNIGNMTISLLNSLTRNPNF